MTETTATPETSKRTRFTLNQATAKVLDRIESYITPFDEDALRKRLGAMKLDQPLVEQIVTAQKAKADVKLTPEEHDSLEAEFYAICKTFYAEEAKVRERVTLPSIIEPLMASGAPARDVFFAAEGFVADQAKKKAEAAKKAAAATK